MIPNNFALTTLSENPEYFEEVIRLIEEEFHYSETQQYEKDFAPLVNPLNFENCYLYIDQETNTVAAHLAICLRTMIKNNAEINIGLIGGIATHKNYRGKNLFTNLMNHVLNLHANDIGLFILWSDLEGLYEKFSFYRSGGLIETGKRHFSFDQRPVGYEKTQFSKLSDKDFNSVTELYQNFNQKIFFTIKRDNKDWSIIREMTSIDLYIKRNLEGEIEKYFCINKGRDLTDIIHEVSCKSPADYLHLLKDVNSFKTWLPETDSDKVSSKEFFYTAFIKLGNLELLNQFLNNVSQGELALLKNEADAVNFRYKDKVFDVSAKDFLQYLFGPKPLTEFVNYKLSIYIAGTDSI